MSQRELRRQAVPVDIDSPGDPAASALISEPLQYPDRNGAQSMLKIVQRYAG